VYPPERVAEVRTLVDAGRTYSEVSRLTGLSRSTIREWAAGRAPTRRGHSTCMICSGTTEHLPPGPYAYLLGLYLGDGYIARHRRGVYRLRITCCSSYPSLMAECAMAMAEILPNRVNEVHRQGCVDVGSYSKHWPCLFPQHGPGQKHKRPIVLVEWQRSIVDRFPQPFLRGLIHSDGCRVLNNVGGRAYPRYEFSNASLDIRNLFARACDLSGIEWRQRSARSLSVAKASSVRRLDEFIGRKR
jgi:hypothetical protein